VKKKIEEAIGYTGALDNYDWVGALSDLTKFKNTTTTETKKGKISIDATNFKWTFTQAEIESEFYKDGKPNNHEYKTQLHITPKAGHPELEDVEVNVTIPGEVYPTGEFAYTQRIQQYWFQKESTKIAENPDERFEIHANVEVVDQVLFGVPADDRFTFNIASSFLNEKIDVDPKYDDENAIIIYNTKGFDYEDLATVYFDDSKYYVYKASDEGKSIDALGAPATSFATGVSGAKYLLYLVHRDDYILYAVKDKLESAKAQDVVVLSGTYQNIATFQGWKYFDGTNKDTYAFAYDLLNKNDHNEVLADQTFTTHMVLDRRDWCFPIDFTSNDASKFDIRYLRPISADVQYPRDVTDAEDKGTDISLAELALFVDWRDSQFGYKASTQRLNYVNYYGIRAIKPNLDRATTNINGANDWRNLKYFKGLSFEDATNEGVPPYSSWKNGTNGFIDQLGVIKYRNNGLNVGDFSIRLPITLLYDWGETSEQILQINIKKTTGQEIGARLK
jgi:hypothetical protein